MSVIIITSLCCAGLGMLGGCALVILALRRDNMPMMLLGCTIMLIAVTVALWAMLVAFSDGTRWLRI